MGDVFENYLDKEYLVNGYNAISCCVLIYSIKVDRQSFIDLNNTIMMKMIK